jgi:cobaltochelatase CobT
LQQIGLLLAILTFLVVLSCLPPFRKFLRRQARFDPGRPYQVYCRDFDLEVEAGKLDAVLAALPARDRKASRHFAGIEARSLPDIERDVAARRASREPNLLQAAARIRVATSQDTLDDTIVSLLIDHSGSMAGQPIFFAARAAMVASDLLHDLGAKQEVLGFTTVRWTGGASREKWLRAGRPPYPGRLNDLLHIVYCGAGERLHARDCMTMLRQDLLKENIDGEAIEWAASRLRRRGERHKYMIVMSDGASVDDSTLHENGDAYMERHLLDVMHGIAQAGDIELAAIGLGHPVERYYARSITVAAPEELDGAVLRLIEQLLCSPPPTSQDSQGRASTAGATDPSRPQH